MYRTPSAALAVGGLPESIEDGRTGLLADDGAGADRAGARARRATARCASASATRRSTARAASRGSAPRARTSPCSRPRRRAERAGLRASLRGSETLKAAGLAAATLASNAIALLFTVLFARLLGADGYGSLAALISTFLILAVPGSALQVVVAREVATGTLGSGTRLASDARRVAAGAAARVRRRRRVLGAAARADRRPCSSVEQIVGGRRDAADGLPVAAAARSSAARCRACTPTARSAGRSCSRRAGGSSPACCWSPPGLGVTGAYLGTPVSMAVTAVVLVVIVAPPDRRRPTPPTAATRLRDLVARRVAGRDRPVPRRRAPERRRDPRQAHDRRRRGRRLRGGGRGGQGGRVGRDRRRALPAAGGDAQGGRGRGPAAGAAARARASSRRWPCRC